MLGVEIEGQEVETVESLADWRGLHPLQRAFIQEQALQCGYCTPGILMAAKALLDRDPDPSEGRIRDWLAGNLCRCTGFDNIVVAVQTAAKMLGQSARDRGSVIQEPDKTVRTPASGDFSVIGTRPARCDAAD